VNKDYQKRAVCEFTVTSFYSPEIESYIFCTRRESGFEYWHTLNVFASFMTYDLCKKSFT